MLFMLCYTNYSLSNVVLFPMQIQLVLLLATLSSVVRGDGSTVSLDKTYYWLTVSEDAAVSVACLLFLFTCVRSNLSANAYACSLTVSFTDSTLRQ